MIIRNSREGDLLEYKTQCVKRCNKTEFVMNTRKRTVVETLYRLPGNLVLQRKYYQIYNLRELQKTYKDRIQYKLSIGYELEKKGAGKVIYLKNKYKNI